MRIEAQRIGHFELQQRLRQGNASETWRAYDTAAQRTVILKFYRAASLDDANSLTDYLHGVEKVASLHQPNIVRIHDIQVLAPRSAGTPFSLICLVVEYIEGETLADYISSTSAVGKIPAPSEVIQLFSALALAFDSAHRHNIIHGNIKPTNILLNQSVSTSGRIGIPMLTDFAATRLTPTRQSNDIPFYLAPEQIKGAAANETSDIYALGVLLYELYTGIHPFRGSRPIAVMMQHVNALPTPPDLVNPSISPALTQVILRCLAKDPAERFPNVTSLAMALANALHIAIPENLRRFALQLGSAALSTDPYAAQAPSARVMPAGATSSAQTGSELPGSMPPARKRRRNALAIASLAALVLILGASLGTWLLIEKYTAGANQSIGQAFFVNSGQLNENTTQGINDELQIELSNLPEPAAGKSYYAWLLGDGSQTEELPLALGRLPVEDGKANLLYPGNSQHANLLATVSRFLITEDDTQNPSSNPLLDQSTWRYYAVIPQTPDPADPLHFSMLDHLRHLLVESPELSIRHLHGGLAFWFARDTATVSGLANGLAEDWQKHDSATLREQVVRILDYLDGDSFIKPDVPAGTPFLADPLISQVALLGPSPQDAGPPGYVYQNEPPPGYVYLIQSHLNGAILSPQATPEQHQLAIQIGKGIDSVRNALIQVYQDARQLVRMTDEQLLQASALTMLDTMATQAQYAYTGQPNPSTGTSQGGALWIYANLQRLATFDVVPYVAPKS